MPRVAYLIALVELSSFLAAAVRSSQVGQKAQVADRSAGSARGAVAALIFGADSAPVLGAAVAVLRLLPFVTDGHPEGQSLREMLVRRVL